MARPRAIDDAVVFDIASKMAAQGQAPTARGVSEQLRSQYGVRPSYSTLQRVLEDWERLQLAEMPADLPSELINALIDAIQPIYRRVIAQAQAAATPSVEAAQRLADDAVAARERAEIERERLRDEVAFLRESASAQRQQYQDLDIQHRALTERLAQRELELASAEAKVQRHGQEIQELQTMLSAVQGQLRSSEARAIEDRQELEQKLATAQESYARALADKDSQLRQARDAWERQYEQLSRELGMQREELQAATSQAQQKSDKVLALSEQIAVLRQERDEARSNAVALTKELERIQHETRKRLAQAEVERAELRERIRSQDQQIAKLIEGRSTIDQRYETLLATLTNQRSAR